VIDVLEGRATYLNQGRATYLNQNPEASHKWAGAAYIDL
jgi:hypothetical protein